MTLPKQWTPGEPITAARLNDNIAESMIARRATTTGGGSSAINESMGNQSSIPSRPSIKLVVAIEDFAIKDTSADLDGVPDDVPSGLVKEVRLNRKSGIHGEDQIQRPFLAYDAVGGLREFSCSAESTSASASASGSPSASDQADALQSKLSCDVFYVMFNFDSKRWEVLEGGGGGIELFHGVILEQCNTACSTYRVQRVHRYLIAGCADCGSASV